MAQRAIGGSEVVALAAELRADARSVGVELTVDDALVAAAVIAPLLAHDAAHDDAWAAEEEERALGLLDMEHLAFDNEVARLVAAA